MSAKITPEHTRRVGIVYVRQSTASQVRGNLESQRRQYALADHARGLGFRDVEVIDQDLGQSGTSMVGRPGFQRLVAQVSLGSVGGVFCLEASRLARNNRDWHHLIDLCSLVGTLLIDPDGVYDPRLGNDRLLLGLKGTMSEFELTLFRQRSLEAKRQKAKRGELRVVLPVGLRWTSEGQIEKVPDVRVQEILQLAFEKFHELGSIRQTLRWVREEQIQLPKTSSRRHDARIEWALPTYASLHGLLTNPFYAGAYAFGKTTTRTVIEGDRARTTGGHPKPMSKWTALIHDHHPGFISWERFEHGRRVLDGNANMKGRMVTGAPQKGGALLAGLLRCGRCGHKLQVHYSGKQNVAHYRCRRDNQRSGDPVCLGFRGRSLEEAMEEEILRVVEPGAIEAALKAAETVTARSGEQLRAAELELEHARYEAERCFRQYDTSDPENRLVTGELERRWNEALTRVEELEQRLTPLQEAQVAKRDFDRGRLLSLAAELPRVWSDPQSDMRLKKRRHDPRGHPLEGRGPFDARDPKAKERTAPSHCRRADRGHHRAGGGGLLRRRDRTDPQPTPAAYGQGPHLEGRPGSLIPQVPSAARLQPRSPRRAAHACRSGHPAGCLHHDRTAPDRPRHHSRFAAGSGCALDHQAQRPR
jgi:DNA invertase Pin-like site-specific DNA recombinase